MYASWRDYAGWLHDVNNFRHMSFVEVLDLAPPTSLTKEAVPPTRAQLAHLLACRHCRKNFDQVVEDYRVSVSHLWQGPDYC